MRQLSLTAERRRVAERAVGLRRQLMGVAVQQRRLRQTWRYSWRGPTLLAGAFLAGVLVFRSAGSSTARAGASRMLGTIGRAAAAFVVSRLVEVWRDAPGESGARQGAGGA